MLNKKLFQIGRKSALAMGTAVALGILGWPAAMPAVAQPTTSPSDMSATEEKPSDVITIEPGKAKQLSFEQKIKKANILLPDVADVIPLEPNELLITAKKAGTTQLILWDENDRTQIITIEVSTPVARLQKQLQTLFPGSKINVEDDNGTITLTGQVRDLKTAAQVELIAGPYGAGKVADLLEIAGGQQIMLKCKFAEVSKQAEKELGFNFAGTDNVSVFGSNIGANTVGFTPGPPLTTSPLTNTVSEAAASMFGQGAFSAIAFDYFIDALENNSLLRTLAEPNLVTTSGQQATFLAGGSFPYPVPQTSGGATVVTIQFQDFGVTLKFTPIVLGNGRIRIHVAPEVSELDYSHAYTIPGGGQVPGLTKRNVDTTVELSQGQTFALAGLLQDDVTASNSQFPVLGDVPVLGALFRSVKYQKNLTELVVLVTPVLVHGIDPADVTPVPGEKWRDPNMAQLYLMGDMGGEVVPPPLKLSPPTGQTPPFEGPAGFQPPPTSGK
ncbi:MAG: type II and III secretion system protein family protein [Tepidisphaeraceae bacterium]